MKTVTGAHVVYNTGIYKIVNKANGHFYIGSSVNLRKRKNEHLCRLRHNSDRCGILQASYNKYGEDNLLFVPIIFCDKDDLILFEQRCVDILNPEYNIRVKDIRSNLGFKMPDSAKKAISESHMGERNPMYGRKFSDEHKRKISPLGRPSPLKGRKRSQEVKDKIRNAMLGDNNPNSKVRRAGKL